MASETAIILQQHLDGAIRAAHQPRRLHYRLERGRVHLQRGRDGGVLQCGSDGRQVWQVRVSDQVQWLCALPESP